MSNRSIDARTVREVMQEKVVTVVPEMSVRELIQRLVEESITGAPVVDENGRVIGVVSVSDVMRLASHEAEIPAGTLHWEPQLSPGDDPDATELRRLTGPLYRAPSETALDEYRVGDIMTPAIFFLGPQDTLRDLLRFFLRGRVHRALVMEENHLLGIVTPFDVLQLIEEELAEPGR